MRSSVGSGRACLKRRFAGLLQWRYSMSSDKRDILEVLKAELAFLEQGGYGRSVRTPWKPTIPFRDSPICLNFNDANRPYPCSACALMRFVPLSQRSEALPCHHIPLDAQGQTVDSLMRWDSQEETEEALASWLRRTIGRLEYQNTRNHEAS